MGGGSIYHGTSGQSLLMLQLILGSKWPFSRNVWCRVIQEEMKRIVRRTMKEPAKKSEEIAIRSGENLEEEIAEQVKRLV